MPTVVHAATLVDTHPLTVGELAQALGTGEPWVMQLVEVEILHVPAQPPERWQFDSGDLQRAREAQRLERDFGANLDSVALILEMQGELRRLRALLAAHGVG